ncbi:MAG: class I SAM-dependent methyltransferase [Bryobacteraceae bacterium]
MDPLFSEDLAYIQAAAFGGLAQGAAPEVLRLLASAAIQIRRVVDVGCGAGPLTAALIQAGFEATGIDQSAELLAIARVAAPRARFIPKSIYDAEIPPCEAILAVGEPLTYHAEDADGDRLIKGFLERVSDVLPAGGMLIFDLIELGEPSLAGRVWRSGDDWAVLVDTKENQDLRTLVRDIETFRRVGQFYRRGREVHTVRLFDTQALCHQLATCGFATETAQAYGSQLLGPRRRAFYCTRIQEA